MTKEISKIDNSLMELQNTQKLCQMLMQSPHYKKIGQEGIFAVVEMAKSVGVDPLQALNGGMYFVRGKVEMSAMMMNTLIRQAGHSITKDKRSNDTICILHGKRADTQDTWVESFSLEDADKAKLLNNPTWKMYTKDMLFARALSRLARQLFPDVIKGCYVQGEIEMAQDISYDKPKKFDYQSPEKVQSVVGIDGAADLETSLLEFPDYRKKVYDYLDRQELKLEELPLEDFKKIFSRIEKLREESCETLEVAHG